MAISFNRANDMGGPAGASDRRAASRQAILLNAQCLVDPDHSSEVWLTDISNCGCQLFTHAGLLQGGKDVVILTYTGERRTGQVAWVSGMRAGLRFDLALPSVALEQLLTARPCRSLRPERGFGGLKDHFGRELAPLPDLARTRKLP